MNTLTKRILSLILAFTIISASIPGFAPGAFAAETHAAEGTEEEIDYTDLAYYGTYDFFKAKYPDMQELESKEDGVKKLSTGKYYVPEGETVYFNCVAGNTGAASAADNSGIEISGTVVIILLNGSSLYARGSNSNNLSTPGRAGILLPTGSTLRLEGTGKLYAYGGSASGGKNGKDGTDATWTNDGKANEDESNGGFVGDGGKNMIGGDGGDGGDGGAGAGAGIGTNGGKGGTATKGGKGAVFGRDGGDSGDGKYNKGTVEEDSDTRKAEKALPAGTLSVKGNVAVTARGGSTGSSGSNGGTGAFRYAKWTEGYFCYGGGRGAGGAGGGGGASIGSGGNGGDGGRGGGGGGAGHGFDGRDSKASDLKADFDGKAKATDFTKPSTGSSGSSIQFYSTKKGNYPKDECKITIGYDEVKEDEDDIDVMYWTGKALEPKVTMVHVPTNTTIKRDSAYAVSYDLNTDAAHGDASIEIVGSGTTTILTDDMKKPAEDLKEENFSILYNPATLKIAGRDALPFSQEDKPAYLYTGEAIEQGFLMHSETEVEVPTEDYSISYKNNVNVGVATVTTTGEGDFWVENSKPVSAKHYIVTPVEIATPSQVFRNIAQGQHYEQEFIYDDINPEPYNTLKADSPVRWEIVKGSLPDGLFLNAYTGVVVGTPRTSESAVVEMNVTTDPGTSKTVQYAWQFADLCGYARAANGDPAEGVRVAVYSKGGLELPGCTTVTDKNGYWGIQIPDSSIGTEIVVKATPSVEEGARPKSIISIGGDESAAKAGKVVTVPARGELVQCDILVKLAAEARFDVGIYGAVDSGTDVVYGDPTDLIPIPKVHSVSPGYAFLGWTTEKGSTEIVEVGTFGTENTVYYAVYGRVGYTVNYANTGDTVIPARVDVQYTDTKLLPTVTRAGYRLAGWRLAGTSIVVTSKTSYGFLANQSGVTAESITLEPVWEIRTDINVTLHANGTEAEPAVFTSGQETHSYVNQTYGTTIDWAPPPIRDGYVMVGWSRTADADATQATTSLIVPDPGEDEKEAVFYAVWVPTTVTVTFDAMGGTDDYKAVGYRGDPLEIPADPTLEGYTFHGWYDSPTGGNKVDPLPTSFPALNTTYYARWGLNSVSCKFWMYSDLHEELKGEPGTLIEYTVPERVGYTFVGWKVKGAENSAVNLILAYPEVSTEYEAVFELGRQVVVAFNLQGGTWAEEGETGERRGGVGTIGTVPANPTRTGYTFGGWYMDLENEDTLFNASEFTFSSDSLTVYSAKWDPITISVMLDWNFPDAPPIAPTNNVVMKAISYSEPVRVGYTFLGWGRKPFDTEYTKSIVTPETDEESVTFYAQWHSVSTSVTLDPAGGKFDSSKDPVTIEGVYGSVVDYVTPSRTGYAFTGWRVADDKNAPLLIKMTFPETPTTYKAIWKSTSTSYVPRVENNYRDTVVDSEKNVIVETIRNSDGSTTTITTNTLTNSTVETTTKKDGSVVTITTQEDGSVKAQIVDGNGIVVDLEEQKNVINPIISHVSVCSRGISCPLTQYHDTPANAWYHDGVHHCVEQSLLIGVDDGRFAPEEVTTRSMVITMLWRIEGKPIVTADIPYADVDLTGWYADPLRWAVSINLLSGYVDDLFGPNDPVTREEIAVMLYRYALHKGHEVQEPDVDILSFPDADKLSDWAIFAMQWTNNMGLIIGLDNGLLDPQGYTVRAQTATILMRFYATVAQDWIHAADERKPEEEERKPGDYE